MPNDPVEIFPNFSSLFADAQKMGVKINLSTTAPLLSVLAQLKAVEPLTGKGQQQARAEWSQLLQANQGQTLKADDLWDWIKKWLVPDPVQAMRIWDYVRAQSKSLSKEE